MKTTKRTLTSNMKNEDDLENEDDLKKVDNINQEQYKELRQS